MKKLKSNRGRKWTAKALVRFRKREAKAQHYQAENKLHGTSGSRGRP